MSIQLLLISNQFYRLIGIKKGAAVVVLLSALKHMGKLPGHINFDWVGVFSGFLPDHREVYKPVLDLVVEIEKSCTDADKGTKIAIPSFHIYGTGDEIITEAQSKRAAALYQDPVIQTHSGGHYIPSINAISKEFKTFIMDNGKK